MDFPHGNCKILIDQSLAEENIDFDKGKLISKNSKMPIYGLLKAQIVPSYTQCAPGFSNLNQKVHGLFHFYNADMHKRVKNQLKNPSVIGLPKFAIVNWLKNTINIQILV